MDLAIRAENLGKCFRVYSKKWDKLKGAFLKSNNHAEQIWAVRNINLSIPPGQTVGIIGPNGSGKTTMLQLIAGLLKSTEGCVEVRGNMATLLELGSGLQMDLTGRENIFVTGSLRGFSRRELNGKVDQIIDFSELEESIDRPIRHYSTGMLMRLAFATAINAEPELLLIDEVFAVGDMAFQHKCIRKIKEMQRNGASIVIVTHDLTAVKSLCDRALLLDRGKEILFGEPEDVTNRYLDLVAQRIAADRSQSDGGVIESNPTFLSPPSSNPSGNHQSRSYHRHGSGEAKVQSVAILNSNGLAIDSVRFGDEVTFRFSLEYFADIVESGLGFFIRDRYGNDIIGINTFEEREPLGSRKSGDRLTVDFTLPLLLRPGSYSVSPGLSYDPHEPRYLDWINNAAFFQMEPPSSGKQIHGFIHVTNRVLIRVL